MKSGNNKGWSGLRNTAAIRQQGLEGRSFWVIAFPARQKGGKDVAGKAGHNVLTAKNRVEPGG
jgi:hypothetical protein